MAARVATKPRATRYANQKELLKAIRVDRRRWFETVFARPWDGAEVRAWLVELAAMLKNDRSAVAALGKLGKGIRAVQEFCAKYPIEGRQIRRGLSVHREVVDDDHTEFRVYLDPPTMPTGAGVWPAMLVSEKSMSGRIVPSEMVVRLAWPPSAPTMLLSCTVERANMTPSGMLANMLCPKVDELARLMSTLGGLRKRAPAWEQRLAIVAIFDRVYGPGELRGDVARLTPAELAGLSILSGLKAPMKGKTLIMSAAINAERKAIVKAQKLLAKLRAEHVPLPRVMKVGDEVQVGGSNAQSAAV
jgi:hypothetical protein